MTTVAEYLKSSRLRACSECKPREDWGGLVVIQARYDSG
jgi:hypothetical protein